MFTDGFEFAETTGDDWHVDVNWSVDEDVLAMAKKKQVSFCFSGEANGIFYMLYKRHILQRPVFTSLDAKIARAKEMRKLKVRFIGL